MIKVTYSEATNCMKDYTWKEDMPSFVYNKLFKYIKKKKIG